MSPVKEPRFFRLEGQSNIPRNQAVVNNISDYRKLFSAVTNERAIGEASTCYFAGADVPAKIHSYIPHCKIICILRHPVDRAFSHYNMLCQSGFSDHSFTEFIEKGRNGKRFIDTVPFSQSFYARHLRRYYDVFPGDQIKVLSYDAFRKDSLSVTRDIYRFIGVDEQFDPDTAKSFNKRFYSKRPIFRKLVKQDTAVLRWARRYLSPEARANIRYRAEKLFSSGNAPEKEKLSPQLRENLAAYYRNDITELQELAGLDFSAWQA